MSTSDNLIGSGVSVRADNVVFMADHSVVLALPALIPAFVIVGVVLYVVAKDRRAERDENAENAGDANDTSSTPTEDDENR
ncbi:hypothetical protein [Rhodococcus sp. G-MC3]|uniref:hypothetical protein n=1 Tax=Rhodococcus sp. G-MC3 TaxID=3046209 RepID=UPI003FA732B8